MRSIALCIVVALFVFQAPVSAIAAPDADRIGQITGIVPEIQGEIVRVAVPRSDLAVSIQGYALQPFQGLTSWAAFQQVAPTEVMVMGDIVLTEGQVDAAMSAALDAGLEVTALHNHFFFETPRVFFMHIGGRGDTESVAKGVKGTLDATKMEPKQAPFAGPDVASPSSIEPEPLAVRLNAKPQSKDGMAKFVFGRTTRMHATEVGSAMGVNTWAVFAGSPKDAVVDGDFAALEGELQAVLRILRRADFHIVAIHNHMTHEEPRMMFLHYWGRGPAEALAGTIRQALDVQGP
jgi:hypothetical protein